MATQKKKNLSQQDRSNRASRSKRSLREGSVIPGKKASKAATIPIDSAFIRPKDLDFDPLVIGVCGGSGSGKTTLVRKILELTGARDILVLGLDHYYRDLSHLRPEQRDHCNFDHPDALDSNLLVTHVRDLIRGLTVERPTYDFSTHARLPEVVKLTPKPVMIIDGILALYWYELREILDLKIYVDVSDDVRFIRRLQRDIRERGRTIDSVIRQYLTTVKSMHDQFVARQRFLADIIISWEDHNERAVNMLVGMIKNSNRRAPS